MKIKEVRDLDVEQLKQKNSELVEEFFRLRLRHASEKIESTALLSSLRKDIARIKTVLKEKEAAK
jgi:large subunit ribosomal protein L29